MADPNTKRIRMTQDRDSYTTGQVVTLPTDQADQLIADGVAVAETDANQSSAGSQADSATQGSGAAGGSGSASKAPEPGFSNSKPAAEQDGIAGKRAGSASSGTSGSTADKTQPR